MRLSLGNFLAVRYYAARVSGRLSPLGPARQQIYFDALATIPEISHGYVPYVGEVRWPGVSAAISADRRS